MIRNQSINAPVFCQASNPTCQQKEVKDKGGAAQILDKQKLPLHLQTWL